MIHSGLEGNEYVSMLSWIMNTYTGPELMQHPELNIDMSSVGPLLNNSVIDSLQQQYLKVGLQFCYFYDHHKLYVTVDCTALWVCFCGLGQNPIYIIYNKIFLCLSCLHLRNENSCSFPSKKKNCKISSMQTELLVKQTQRQIFQKTAT